MFVPRADSPHGPLTPLLLALTFVSGLVDAVSLLVLGTIFVANMTGNVVFLGLSVAGVKGFVWWASLIALAAFIVGALVGGRIALRRGDHRAQHLRAGVLIECILVAVAAVMAFLNPSFDWIWTMVVAIVALALAMGIQNAVARSLAVPDLTTSVLTQTLTGMFSDPAAGVGGHWTRRLVIVLVLFAGAVVGGVLILAAHHGLALLTAEVLLIVVLVVASLHRSSTAEWTQRRVRG